jgi:hypothetical protein
MSSRRKRNLDRQLSFRASPDLVAAIDAYAERLADRGPEYPISTAAALRGLVARGLEEVKRADADEAAA